MTVVLHKQISYFGRFRHDILTWLRVRDGEHSHLYSRRTSFPIFRRKTNWSFSNNRTVYRPLTAVFCDYFNWNYFRLLDRQMGPLVSCAPHFNALWLSFWGFMNGSNLWKVEQHNGFDTLQRSIFAYVGIIFHKFSTVLVISVSATPYKVQAWKLSVFTSWNCIQWSRKCDT
jgi:hypothetical protein